VYKVPNSSKYSPVLSPTQTENSAPSMRNPGEFGCRECSTWFGCKWSLPRMFQRPSIEVNTLRTAHISRRTNRGMLHLPQGGIFSRIRFICTIICSEEPMGNRSFHLPLRASGSSLPIVQRRSMRNVVRLTSSPRPMSRCLRWTLWSRFDSARTWPTGAVVAVVADGTGRSSKYIPISSETFDHQATLPRVASARRNRFVCPRHQRSVSSDMVAFSAQRLIGLHSSTT